MPQPIESPADIVSPPDAASVRARRLSPTDISQFVRLEQCEQYLRLRMQERAVGSRFMADYGVAPQAIPPLLTRSGAAFEASVEAAVAVRFPTLDCAAEAGREGDRGDDNAGVVAAIRALAPGDVQVHLQPRLQVELGGWQLHGDVDLLRLERDEDGDLHALITDIKSSTRVKVEHRLQVAFYHSMIARLLEQEGIEGMEIRTAILYRGPACGDRATGRRGDGATEETGEAEREAAARLLGVEDGFLEIVAEPEAYLESVRDLVTGPESAAWRIARTPLAELPYHLSYKCDGCLYNEHCMKWSAEQDDLSLLPHLAARDKTALRGAGLTTTRALAMLKEPCPSNGAGPGTRRHDLVPAPGKEALGKRLAATWPVGPRIDELVHRARRYRKWKGDALDALPDLPQKGHSSLPVCDATHHPNLVRIYLDAQHDYLQDRIYLLGALVVGCEGGVEVPERRRSVVHLADQPPGDHAAEERLFVHWLRDTLQAVVEIAAPDAEGQSRAPIHLIFFDAHEQQLLLDGLARHATRILGATPLYDFVTQLAAFDSPVATFLDAEIREQKNYPMVCQSLQAVAAFLQFDWNAGERYRELFRARMFDYWGKLSPDEASGSPWYFSRARFSSQIPLEYAYAAWGELPEPVAGEADELAPYRAATPALMQGLQARRLAALEWVARDLKANDLTQKRPFDLPELASFTEKAGSLAQALEEFVTIERHVDLGAWKAARLIPPERRVLMGETLLVRYYEADQEPDVAAQNRENERRRQLRTAYEAAGSESTSGATRAALTKEQKEETRWSQAGMRFRLRMETDGIDCSLDEALALTTLREGERLVLSPRWTCDERMPAEQRAPFTPTPKQMLYGSRTDLARLDVTRDEAGRAVSAMVEIEMQEARGGSWSRGFAFGSMDRPLVEGDRYTLDADPNDFHGYKCLKVVEGLGGIETGAQPGRNTLYDRITCPGEARVAWPPAAVEGQARFLAGLDALHAAGALHDFEASKRAYIGARGDEPILLVQGPPGTGKSYATAFALLARMQGAMAADRDFRAFLACKTHAATDVLLQNLLAAQQKLRELSARSPEIVGAYFDPRLLEAPLFRVEPKQVLPPGVIPLAKDSEKVKGQPRNVDEILAHRWCVVAASPGGIYNLVKAKWKDDLFGHAFADALVLDEASQMNLPEAMMAALPLRADGLLIVVGDHRQMPPIVKHDWESEPRRTFQEFRSYESLYLALLPLATGMVKFEESFRLHAVMAEFLRREIYEKDGIPYRSRRDQVLPERTHEDPFVAAVLSPAHPIVVLLHDEDGSQTRNPFEQALVEPVLRALADPDGYALDAAEGLGIVVPHRAQRAAMRQAFPFVAITDPTTGEASGSAVDTVERFQGGEREAILVSATESDREYLLASSKFLLDPRRLTVALSRARRKMILVASRSVFSLFAADEETFAHAQLWKNLLRRTCTAKLWDGEREGRWVEVWGAGSHSSKHPTD